MKKTKQILGIFAILLIASQAHAFKNKDKKSEVQKVCAKNTKIEEKKEIPETVNVDKKITFTKYHLKFIRNHPKIFGKKITSLPTFFAILPITFSAFYFNKAKNYILPKVNNGYEKITYNLGQSKAYQKALEDAGATIIGLATIIKGRQKNN